MIHAHLPHNHWSVTEGKEKENKGEKKIYTDPDWIFLAEVITYDKQRQSQNFSKIHQEQKCRIRS